MLTAASVSSVFILSEKNKARSKHCLTYLPGSTVAQAAVGMTVQSDRCRTGNKNHNSWVFNQVPENSGTYMICVDGTNLCYGHEAKKEDWLKYEGKYAVLFEAAGKLFKKDLTSPFQRWTNTTAQPKRFMNVGTKLCDRVFFAAFLAGGSYPLETTTCKDDDEQQQWNFVDTV